MRPARRNTPSAPWTWPAPDDHLARGGAAGFLGFAAWARGDVSTALETFSQAVASLHAAGSLVDELSGTVVLADLWLAAGRPSKARRLCTQALEVAEAHGARVARATAELHVGLSEIDVEAGDLESARRHLEAAAALADRAGMNESRFRWFVAMGLLARADGDPEGAGQLLDQAEQLYRPGFYPEVRPIAAIRARIWIAQGKLSEAADWARDRGVSATDEARYLSEYDHLTLVRLLLAQHRAHQDTGALDQAVGLLDRLSRGRRDRRDAPGVSSRSACCRPWSHDAQGRRPRALEILAQALDLAPEPESYVRLFLDEGAPMLSLLRDAERAASAGDHARRLLSARRTARDRPRTRGRAARSRGRGVERPGTAGAPAADSELTGPEIARELFVSHNTVRTHTKHIFTKLDVTNRRAAVVRARERGLL